MIFICVLSEVSDGLLPDPLFSSRAEYLFSMLMSFAADCGTRRLLVTMSRFSSFLPVDGGVVVQILPQSGAFKRESREQALRARPGKNVRVHLRVGLCRCRASDRACRDGSFRAQRELARKQFVGSAFVHHQHDQVGRRSADLESDAPAFDADRARRGPAGPTLFLQERILSRISRRR